jgi:hypothetical protein
MEFLRPAEEWRGRKRQLKKVDRFECPVEGHQTVPFCGCGESYRTERLSPDGGNFFKAKLILTYCTMGGRTKLNKIADAISM